MENSNKISKIKGTVKHYAWGGKTFLPQLLHLLNEEGKPYAEYWLGDKADARFVSLPYLLKVLDVEKMLSIQVHPAKEVAEMKFKEENDQGIPLDAANRNYKDDNHKPELLSPLSDFYLLHGFKPVEETKKILKEIPELKFLIEKFGEGNYREMYTTVMTMPQKEVNKTLTPLLDRILLLYNTGKLPKEKEDFWAARAALHFTVNGNIDRGIFSIYLFNVVKMTAGEGLFQDAGLPHAYLEGHTIEIMANSDNVLRGGLTPKYIDVKELLENVRFAGTVPNIIRRQAGDGPEQVYHTPAKDFQLSRIVIDKGKSVSLPAGTSDIYFIYKGSGSISAGEQKTSFRSGDALLTTSAGLLRFEAIDWAILFRATSS